VGDARFLSALLSTGEKPDAGDDLLNGLAQIEDGFPVGGRIGARGNLHFQSQGELPHLVHGEICRDAFQRMSEIPRLARVSAIQGLFHVPAETSVFPGEILQQFSVKFPVSVEASHGVSQVHSGEGLGPRRGTRGWASLSRFLRVFCFRSGGAEGREAIRQFVHGKRLGQITVEVSGQQTFPIPLQGVGSERDDGDSRAGPLFLPDG